MEILGELKFAVTPEALLSLIGMAPWCWLFGEMFKRLWPGELKPWQVNIAVVSWGLLWGFIALGVTNRPPNGTQIASAFLVGFTGAAIATLGYEVLKNGFGFMGLFKAE